MSSSTTLTCLRYPSGYRGLSPPVACAVRGQCMHVIFDANGDLACADVDSAARHVDIAVARVNLASCSSF